MEDKVKIFKALGNETRFMMFKNILQTPYICSVDTDIKTTDIIRQAACVSTIASEFHYSLATISKHLKELRSAKLIKMTKLSNKIYVEPNYETVAEISECFSRLNPLDKYILSDSAGENSPKP